MLILLYALRNNYYNYIHFKECGVRKFNKIIMPRVIPKAEGANTVSRGPYTQIVRLER